MTSRSEQASYAKVVPIEDVVEDPHNARQVFDAAKLETLAESIRAQGILQDPLVRLVKQDGREVLQLVAGHRRVRAAKLAGVTQIRVVVQEGLDDQAAALAAATENLQREDLTPYEQARAFKTAIDLGMQKKELCERAGIVFNTLKARLQLLELPESVAQHVGVKGFGVGHAQALLPLAKNPELLAPILQDLGKAEEAPRATEMWRHAKDLLEEKNLAVDATWDLSWEVKDELKDWQDRLRKLPHIEIPGGYKGDPPRLFITDPKAYLEVKAELQQEAKAKREARAQRQRGKDAKEDKPRGPTPDQRALVRMPQAQLDQIVKRFKDHKAGWGDDLQMAIAYHILGSFGPNNQAEADALSELTGIEKTDRYEFRLLFEDAATFRALWKKDRAKVDKLVAFAVMQHTRTIHHEMYGASPKTLAILDDAPLDKILLGKTHEETLAELKRQVRAELEAKTKKASPSKDGKKPKATPAVAPAPKGKKSAHELLKEVKQAKKPQPAAKDKAKAAKKGVQRLANTTGMAAEGKAGPVVVQAQPKPSRVKVVRKAKAAPPTPTRQAPLPVGTPPEPIAAADVPLPSAATQRLQDLARRERAKPDDQPDVFSGLE